MEILIGAIVYLLITSGLYRVAKYSDHMFAIGAFIPVFNLFLIINLAGYGIGLFLIFLLLSGIRVVNVFFSILLFLIYAYVVFLLGMRTVGNFLLSILTIFFPFIGFPIMGSLMKKKHLRMQPKKRFESGEFKAVTCNTCKTRIGVKLHITEFKCPKCQADNVC